MRTADKTKEINYKLNCMDRKELSLNRCITKSNLIKLQI